MARTWISGPVGRLGRRLVLVLAAAVLAVALGLFGLRLTHSDKVYPAIQVAGMDLGGLTREEARATLQQRADSLERGTVRFTFNDRTWEPTLRDLGATFDVNGTLERAYQIGREDAAGERLDAVLGLVRGDRALSFGLTFDHAILAQWFDRVDGELGLPPHDARLSVQGTAVTVVPEVDGTIVDRPAATATVLTAIRSMSPVAAPLPVVARTAVVRAADLAAARDRLATVLAQPLQLSYGQDSWTLSGADLASFVVQRIDPAKQGAAAHSMSLDQEKLTAWLEERLAPSINRDPKDAIVGWNQGPVAVEWSEDGLRLRSADLAAEVERHLFGDHAPIALPVDVIKPTIDANNLGALGITTLLGRGDSNYAGSDEGRATNLELGSYYLNNTLIPPGGWFSFNHTIGVINAERGFVESNVVDGERIGRDIGGGICQVSTTVFRAAYLAGMPIGEWNPHRYRIPFYEYDGWAPGLDASILQPTEDPSTWGDFTFKNATDAWMLVESWTTGEQIVVNLYGADLGLTVETAGPVFGKTIPKDPDLEMVNDDLEPGTWKQTESAQDGVEVIHNRTVYDRNGNVLRQDEWYTLFWSRGNVYQVSPDMVCRSPAGSCFRQDGEA